MSAISFSKDKKAWAQVLDDHQVWSDNAAKSLETGKSQLSACLSSWDWSNPPMISHHSSMGSKVMESWPDSALLLEAFPSAAGWEDRAPQPKCEEPSWSDCPFWVARTSVFPQGSAEGWGLCLQALCSSMLSYDCAFLLWEAIWNAQALVSCQEIAVLRLPATISLSHPFPHWWWVSTSWALFQLLSDFFGIQTNFFGFFFPCRKGQHKEHRQEGCPVLMQALSQGYHHIAQLRWLEGGRGL